MPKGVIQTIADFAGLEAGQVITLGERKVVYLGFRLVRTCGCSCMPNCEQFPHIAYFDEQSGSIEVREIRSLELPRPQKITGMGIAHVVTKEHEAYGELEATLKGAGLM